MIRRWELIDTKNGQPINVVSRHIFRRSAEHWRKWLSPFLHARADADYKLAVRRVQGQ